jgi:hypothetical protein
LIGARLTYVDNVCVLFADDLVVPLPDFSSDGLTDGAEDSQVLHLMLDVLVASALEESERSWGDVELCDLVLRADLPVSAEIGVCGSTLEDHSGDTKNERSVDDICVTSDPADITTTEEGVRVVNVKDVLARHGGTQQVASSCVHDTLGLASGAGSVEQEEGVLRVHGLRRVV